MTEEKECFVIGPIDKPESVVRKNADMIIRSLVKPIAEEFEYNVVRADDINQSGMITMQILDHIAQADLVIADLTGDKPNVYYELAIRHMFLEPFILIAQQGQKLPFDIQDYRTVFYDKSNWESYDQAKKELKGHIADIAGGNREVKTLVSMELRDMWIKKQGDSRQIELAEITRYLEEIKETLRNVERNVGERPPEPEPDYDFS